MRHVTVGGMLAWEPPVNNYDGRIRRSNAPIHPREEVGFIVEGDVWRAKVEPGDCDLHVELSAPGVGADADRIIVELPSEPAFADARATLMRALRCRGGDCDVGRAINLRRPVRMRFAGLAFWDAAHWRAEDPRRGKGHGTSRVGSLWELHPAWIAELVHGGL